MGSAAASVELEMFQYFITWAAVSVIPISRREGHYNVKNMANATVSDRDGL